MFLTNEKHVGAFSVWTPTHILGVSRHFDDSRGSGHEADFRGILTVLVPIGLVLQSASHATAFLFLCQRTFVLHQNAGRPLIGDTF
jgi:hypothetical protein